MADESGTFEALARELGRALAPLEQRLAAGEIKQLFTELGLTVPGATPLPAPLVSALGDAAGRAAQLPPLIAQLESAITAEDIGAIVNAGVALVENVTELVLAIQTVATQLDNASGGLAGVQPADIEAFAVVLAERVAEYTLLTYLEGYWPRVSLVLRAMGLVDHIAEPGHPTDPALPPYTRKTLHLDRLADLFSDPATHFQTVYDWGSPTFDAARLLDVVKGILFSLGVPSLLEPVAPSSPLNQLVIPPARITPEPPGVSLRFDSDMGSDLGVELPISDDWKLKLGIDGALDQSVGILVEPPLAISFVPAGGVGARITLETAATAPIRLLTIDAGSGVTIEKFSTYFAADLAPSTGGLDVELGVGAAIEGGVIKIGTSGSDGFLQNLLSGVNIESNFDLGVGYSTDQGVYFEGAATLEIQLASHISLGPIEITALTIIVGIDSGGFPIGLAADIKAELGPLQVVVEGIGFEALFELKGGNDGNLGPLDLTPRFRPPNGAGLSLDTGIVKGGGYLFFDPDNGEYAGIAELSIAEIVTVKAIGLITTKMPDGSDGFSLLLIITAEFSPIQLGFGFTLNGLGGLLGLNRSVLLDVLRDGVRTGAINSIMFPSDPVANAPRIISDLKAIFPVEEGTFLIGPMAKLGWGTPSLVTLSLGVIVEVPPGNIAILGVLLVALPDEDSALIKIQVNFLGVLDLDKQMLSFDASLFDSRVLFLTLEGDMAVRVKWGDNPGFVLSVGGFHPAFDPPAGLGLPATMKRLTVKILDTDWARIRIENYFAVTSNTVQFGAHAHLFFGFDAANVSGEVGFDVLFQFSPFYFIAQISGSLSIKVFGFDLLSIRLRFSLEGPTPWRAKGTGSISLLFFSVDIDFDHSWGDQADTALPPIDVMPLIVAELEKDTSWRALPPPQSNQLVSIREIEGDALVLHPFGALTVEQRAMPLELELELIGNQKPSDVSRVDVTAAVSGPDSLPLSPVSDQFAIAQYQELSDSEKLSRPSYQALKSGVTVGAAGALQSSKMTRRTIAYDVTIIDKEPQRPGRLAKALGALFHPFLRGAAVSRSPISRRAKEELDPFADKVAVIGEGFAVVSQLDNRPVASEARFASEAMARDWLRAKQKSDPSLAATLHVLPDSEVNSE